MSGYVPKTALANMPKNCSTWLVASVDIHALCWKEYEDCPLNQDAKISKVGCMFIRGCDLLGSVADHKKRAGFFPVKGLSNWGELSIIVGHETDVDADISLKKISGNTLPAVYGTLLVDRPPIAAAAAAAAAASCGEHCTA
ncbi:hypothetical protein BI292_05115 [Pseudomonas sp. 43NM1]|uniref:hypothetical protein n=1 Tax=Pseudomonas sp. 43NM1 TaxID=1904755 RepID=UPI000C3382E3|nr:hypothetical protein [Pseudomonas sp. 43NM1]PKH14631.1 hypothetical protein BI292_05115 [Pseudomonas sp. 43NM1]